VGRFGQTLRRGLERLSFRSRLLLAVWLLFALLVAGRIHGSSIELSSGVWAPGQSHLIASPLLARLGPRAKKLREPLMATPRMARSDEWAISTLWALAQFHHEPRFPVRNTNIGLGQNMLLVSNLPVLHPSLIARPATWGYLMFGAQVGLAWSWWLPLFLCFTAMVLLLELLFPGDRLLPALGALWVCLSAVVICWSHSAAPGLAYGALGTVGLYWLLCARTARRAVAAGLLAGWAGGAFAIYLYVPWMVPVAWVCLAILVGLMIRNPIARPRPSAPLAIGLLATVLVTAAIVVPFVISAGPELRALGQSAYPGQRRLHGGDGTFTRVFAGFFNFLTVRKPADAPVASEWADMFLFFPAVIAASLISSRVRRRLDATAWLLLGLCLALLIYVVFGSPQWLADLTLLSRSPSPRTLLGLGLASIVASLYLLRQDPSPAVAGAEDTGRIQAAALGLVALGTAALYYAAGQALANQQGILAASPRLPVGLVAAGILLLAALLLFRARRAFAVALAVALVASSGTFNPLSRGFPPLDHSELYQALKSVRDVDQARGRRPFWVGSGGPSLPTITTVMSAMGARTLTGVFQHPQIALWRALDPEGKHDFIYNRYSETHYFPLPLEDKRIVFTLPRTNNFNLRASPTHPKLKALGVRYGLTFLAPPGIYGVSPVVPVYTAKDKRFQIWRLPD
jgi:hypothetical protein